MKWLMYIVLIPFVSGFCDFPSHLRGSWSYQDRNESIIDNYYNRYTVHVDGDTLRASAALSAPQTLQLEPFNWTCVQENDDNKGKFVVQVNNDKFMCVEFLIRAESVVQMKTTDEATSVAGVRCEKNRFNLDPWPLLRDRWRSSRCPSIGGFWADFYDQSNNFLFGKRSTGAERIEFECTKGEGIFMFTDRNFDTNKQQLFKRGGKHLGCRGFWKEGKFTFIATGGTSDGILKLTHNTIFRYNTDEGDSDNFDVYIFKDAVAPTVDVPDASFNFVKARLQREDVNSLCVNYRYEDFCKDRCDHYASKLRCARTCGVCSVGSSVEYCEFNTSTPEENFFGEWLLSSEADKKVIMDNTWVNFTNYESFRCKETSRFGTYIVKTPTNGCTPRYACFRKSRKSPSVSTYIISRPLPSVYALSYTRGLSLDSDFCISEKYFKYNHDASSLQYFTYDDHVERVIVKTKDIKSVNCDLNYLIYVDMNISSDAQCDVTLIPENHSLVMSYSNCTDGLEKQAVSYDCLYSKVPENLERDKYALWVVEPKTSSKSYQCIAIGSDFIENEHRLVLYMVPLEDCRVHNNELYSLKYAASATDPKAWVVDIKGSPITSFVKVEIPVEVTTSSATGEIGRDHTGKNVTRKPDQNNAMTLCTGTILLLVYTLFFILI